MKIKFFILIFFIFTKYHSQKITFEYKVDHKFDIIDNKIVADSICLSLIAKEIKLEEVIIKKDIIKNSFYIDLNNLSKYNYKYLVLFIYHQGYSINGKFKNKKLTLTYINKEENYKKNIFKYIEKNFRYYSFVDEIDFEDKSIGRRSDFFIDIRKLESLKFINEIKQENNSTFFYVINEYLQKYIIKVNKNLDKSINSKFFHDKINYGIETFEDIYSKYTLVSHQIKN